MITINGFELPLAAVAGFTSAFVAAIAAILVWLQWQERRLRQDDVLKWAIDVIRNLQTLYLTLTLDESSLSASEAGAARSRIAIETSVLVEQGRLFFKNTPHPTHG